MRFATVGYTVLLVLTTVSITYRVLVQDWQAFASIHQMGVLSQLMLAALLQRVVRMCSGIGKGW